ncbi:hypothetical protein ACIO53_23010 [Streptomyces sp. NPDC087305]|uniref:hypothetical protein n=1 Tax=Streptomyces sp. NPDC087305 TaxID=3365781 RepID=UPI0038169007
MYDQTTKRFYAVTRNNPAVAPVSRWDKAAKTWVAENGKKIGKALIDLAPTLIQGASTFMDGRAKTITNAVGVGAQGIAVVKEGYHAVQGYRAGEYMDPIAMSAMASRAVAAGSNLASTIVGEGTAGTALSGVGTYSAGVGTTIDLMHDPHANRGLPMYGVGNNPQLGYGMGEVAPGYQTPHTQSSYSSLSNPNYSQQPAAATSGYQPEASSAGYYNAPVTDTTHYEQHSSSSDPSSSAHHAAAQEHVVRR